MAWLWKRTVWLAALLVVTPAPAAALDPDLGSHIDEMVEPLLRGEMAVGLVVGVIDSSGTEVAGYGTTSLEAGRTPGGSTLFEIGSLSKVFCALLLADMVESGDARLDDRAGDCLPPFVTVPQYHRNPERQITLQDLVSHTSGFPRLPSNLEPREVTNPYADYSVAQMYSYVSEYALPREPGVAYEYSNIGMGLLGHILSLKTDKSFEDLVVERIADPLGMKDTRVALSDEQTTRFAEGHDADGRPAPTWDIPAIPAAGALRSTVNDLLLFLSANLGLTETPLSNAIAATHQPILGINDRGDGVGMAWHLQSGGVIWHNGQSGGYHSIVAFHKALGIGVVVLSNSAVMAIDKLGLSILKLMAGEEVEPLQVRVPVHIDPTRFGRYAGGYELPMDMTVRVFHEGGYLFVQPKHQAPVRLYPESETRFFLKVIDAQVEFLMDEETGQATHLIWSQGDREIAGKRTD